MDVANERVKTMTITAESRESWEKTDVRDGWYHGLRPVPLSSFSLFRDVQENTARSTHTLISFRTLQDSGCPFPAEAIQC